MRPATIMAVFLFLHPAAAQSPPAGGGEPEPPVPAQAAPESPVPTHDTALSHSALKAITYKTGTTAANLTIFSIAAGGVVAGAALTAFGLAASVVVYTINDYAWENHSPPPVKKEENEPFDMKDEFWRTTKKFATYKAATVWIKAIKAASMYAYTGSASATAAAVSAATVVNAGIFYANNFAWDYYDSLALPKPATAPVPEPAAPPNTLPKTSPVAESTPPPLGVPKS